MTDNQYPGVLFQNGDYSKVLDDLTQEVALQINVNGEAFTVTMRTPGHDEDLAQGLLFTEGLYRKAESLVFESMEKDKTGEIVAVDLSIPSADLLKQVNGNRNIASYSSCGLCGKTDLDDVLKSGKSMASGERLKPELLDGMYEQMDAHQGLFKSSGGSHAAGAYTIDGELLVLREDIGRHNAVDKVIGALIREGNLSRAACLLVSGRISYEIVSKAYEAGISNLAAISATSTLAVEKAEEWGVSLFAFCRKGKATAYSKFEHLKTAGKI